MIITQVHLVLGTKKGANLSDNGTDVSSWASMQLACWLQEYPSELNINGSTISRLQRCFREFGSMSNRPHNHRPCVWRCVGNRFADVNVVNRVPHGGSGVMAWAGISYRQQTQLHFIDCNLNAQRYCDGILRLIFIFKVFVANRSVFPVMWNP